MIIKKISRFLMYVCRLSNFCLIEKYVIFFRCSCKWLIVGGRPTPRRLGNFEIRPGDMIWMVNDARKLPVMCINVNPWSTQSTRVRFLLPRNEIFDESSLKMSRSYVSAPQGFADADADSSCDTTGRDAIERRRLINKRYVTSLECH